MTITPKSSGLAYGRIMEFTPDLRNGVGDIVAVVGTPSQPLKVDISGVTVDGWDPQGRPVAVEAGILFLDAKGSVVRSHVTNVVTSEGDTAYTKAGGYRGDQPGIGIAQTTNALYAPVDGARQLRIERTRVEKYNKIGVLIDGAVNDSAPFSPSGTIDWGVIVASQIIGRTQCINYQGTGNCSLSGTGTPGGPPLSTGPLFGQDGLRVTAGSYATVESSTISQNLVLGTGAPVKGDDDQQRQAHAGRGRPLHRRQAQRLHDRDGQGQLLAHLHQQHHGQRLRGVERAAGRDDGGHGQRQREPDAEPRQPARRREQLVGPVRHRRPPTRARRSRRRRTRTRRRTASTAPRRSRPPRAPRRRTRSTSIRIATGPRATRTRASSRS